MTASKSKGATNKAPSTVLVYPGAPKTATVIITWNLYTPSEAHPLTLY